MTWPDHVSVFHKLSYLPSASESSFILDVMIVSELHQRPSARCVEDIVVYDYKKGRKVAIRDFMMKAFEVPWKEQEVCHLFFLYESNFFQERDDGAGSGGNKELNANFGIGREN